MSTPTLLTIPREMRQRILKYAFDDAGEQDLKLNNFLRKSYSWDKSEDQQALASLATGYYQPDDNECDGPAYFPNLDKLVQTLKLTTMELHDDTMFVLAKTLSRYVQVNTETEEEKKDSGWRLLWAKNPELCNHVWIHRCSRARRMRPLDQS